MKKILFLSAILAVFILNSCGDEAKKDDEKKVESKYSSETLEQLETLKNEWITIDEALTKISGYIQNFDDLIANTQMDSAITVVGKLKKEQKDLAMPILDSMKNDGTKIFTVLETFENENANWERVMEEFLAYQTAVEKNEIEEAEAKEKGNSYSEVFNEFKEKISKMNALYEELKANDEALKAILAVSK